MLAGGARVRVVAPTATEGGCAGSRAEKTIDWREGSFEDAPKQVTCPAINLSSKGTGVGIQTMQTNLLKNVFGGDTGTPTPAGIRMHGIFAAPTGLSVQFYPESVSPPTRLSLYGDGGRRRPRRQNRSTR